MQKEMNEEVKYFESGCVCGTKKQGKLKGSRRLCWVSLRRRIAWRIAWRGVAWRNIGGAMKADKIS